MRVSVSVNVMFLMSRSACSALAMAFCVSSSYLLMTVFSWSVSDLRDFIFLRIASILVSLVTSDTQLELQTLSQHQTSLKFKLTWQRLSCCFESCLTNNGLITTRDEVNFSPRHQDLDIFISSEDETQTITISQSL